MSDSDSTKMPEPTRGEMALTVGKIAASFIPVFGGAASEVLGAIITPLLEKRQKEWLEQIARELEDLSEQVEQVTPESLSHNESFVTTFLHASQTALRNHQQEKLEALRNAVLNAATPGAPDDDLQLIFLEAIDTLTAWHLRMLFYFDSPREWAAKHGLDFAFFESNPPALASTIGPARLLEGAFPELKGNVPFYELLYDELARRGFLRGDAKDLHFKNPNEMRSDPRTTEIGKQFIRSISSPIK